MFKELIAAVALGTAALLAFPLAGAQAAAIRPEVATPQGAVTTVQARGRGGFSRGPSMRGFKGMSRGPRVGGFSRGPGRSVYRGRGPSRFTGRGYRGPRHAGRHYKRHRHRRGFGVYYGLPYLYAYGAYDGYGCAYLRRRAIRTGSSYWWRRYEQCRYGYEY